jgi:hypothetical protein
MNSIGNRVFPGLFEQQEGIVGKCAEQTSGVFQIRLRKQPVWLVGFVQEIWFVLSCLRAKRQEAIEGALRYEPQAHAILKLVREYFRVFMFAIVVRFLMVMGIVIRKERRRFFPIAEARGLHAVV